MRTAILSGSAKRYQAPVRPDAVDNIEGHLADVVDESEQLKRTLCDGIAAARVRLSRRLAARRGDALGGARSARLRIEPIAQRRPVS